MRVCCGLAVRPNRRVCRSTDGIRWDKCPPTESVAKHFLAYRKDTYAVTTFGEGSDRLVRLRDGKWDTVCATPDGTGFQYIREFRNSLFLGGSNTATETAAIYCFAGSSLKKVFEADEKGGFFSGFARVRQAGREWLYAACCAGWRARDKRGAVYRTADGTHWELAQAFDEAECWTVATGEGTGVLYAATRQEGGNGKIYRVELK